MVHQGNGDDCMKNQGEDASCVKVLSEERLVAGGSLK
jgi:hypothetical protein